MANSQKGKARSTLIKITQPFTKSGLQSSENTGSIIPILTR